MKPYGWCDSHERIAAAVAQRAAIFGVETNVVREVEHRRVVVTLSSRKGTRRVPMTSDTTTLKRDLAAALEALATKNLPRREPLHVDVGPGPHRFAQPAQ